MRVIVTEERHVVTIQYTRNNLNEEGWYRLFLAQGGGNSLCSGANHKEEEEEA